MLTHVVPSDIIQKTVAVIKVYQFCVGISWYTLGNKKIPLFRNKFLSLSTDANEPITKHSL